MWCHVLNNPRRRLAHSGPGSPSTSAEPPKAARRVRGGGGAGLGPCPCRRDLCACSSAAVVGSSYTLGVSICSSCSARARCLLASTRLPTRKYVCPTCRACAAACRELAENGRLLKHVALSPINAAFGWLIRYE